jgi:hypothetical protein
MNEKGQSEAVAYALALFAAALAALVILTAVGIVGPAASRIQHVQLPSHVSYPEPVQVTVSEATLPDQPLNWWNAQSANALATESLSAEALDAAHARLIAQLSTLVAASELTVEAQQRLTHLMRDRAHVTAWLAVKIAINVGADFEVYLCPPSDTHCGAYAFVVGDEREELCAVAYVKSEPDPVTQRYTLLTSYYAPCYEIHERLIRRGCTRVFNVRLIIPIP